MRYLNKVMIRNQIYLRGHNVRVWGHNTESNDGCFVEGRLITIMETKQGLFFLIRHKGEDTLLQVKK